MWVCMHTHTHTHPHTHTHLTQKKLKKYCISTDQQGPFTWIKKKQNTYMWVHMHICTHTNTHTYTYTHKLTSEKVSLHIEDGAYLLDPCLLDLFWCSLNHILDVRARCAVNEDKLQRLPFHLAIHWHLIHLDRGHRHLTHPKRWCLFTSTEGTDTRKDGSYSPEQTARHLLHLQKKYLIRDQFVCTFQ